MSQEAIRTLFERLDDISTRLARLEGRSGLNEWIIRALIGIIAALTGANIGN